MKTNITDTGFNIAFDGAEIVNVRISASSEYNSASVVVKPSNDEFFECFYEWKGKEYIPSFVLELMSYIKNNTEKSDVEYDKGTVYRNEELYKEYKEFMDKSNKGV